MSMSVHVHSVGPRCSHNQTFIAELATDFVDSVKATNNEHLRRRRISMQKKKKDAA